VDGDYTLMEEWEEHMSDFQPADLITFEILSRSTEVFFENIKVVPAIVRGAYFVSSSANSEITLEVIFPKLRISPVF